MRVIFVIPFSPKYENLNAATSGSDYTDYPYTTNKSGEKVFFPKYDWGGLIGEHVLAADKTIHWEVWRPDDRADIVYQHVFDDGLIYRSYPVTARSYYQGMQRKRLPYSDLLEQELKTLCNQDPSTVVLLATTVEFCRLLHRAIRHATAKVLYYHFISEDYLIPKIGFTYNILKLIHRVALYFQEKRRLGLIGNIQVMHQIAAEKLNRLYPDKRVFFARIGIDLSFWENCMTKCEARKALGLPEHTFIFLMSQRLTQEYQLDKWLQALHKAKDQTFLCIITGTGIKTYVDCLARLVTKYDLNEKVRFTGFISDKLIRTYLSASDVFVSVPNNSGSTVSVVKAMAMGLPIIQTDNGATQQLLLENNAGILLNSRYDESWSNTISAVLAHELVIRTIPVDWLKREVSWDTCSRQWIDAINSI